MTIPMLDETIGLAAEQGGHEVVLGMAHRGRLNVLAHVLGRSETILREFEGERTLEAVAADPEGGTGDVKYHLGAEGTRKTLAGEITVTLASNPSHLEAVDELNQEQGITIWLVDGFEVAGVGRERHRDLAGRRLARALGAEVVLDVAGAALRVGRDGLERALALELAEDRLVGTAEHVREHVQAPAVRHAEHDLVSAFLRGEPDRLVEHRDHHVEPLDRELLLAEERPAQVALEALDLGQALEQPALVVRVERVVVAARLDHRPQPDALLVVGDVLDLVGARAAVDLA